MTELTFLPCALEHLALIEPQDGNVMEKAYFLQPGFHYMIEDNFAISAWLGHKCIAAAGIVSIYPHRGTAWSLLGKGSGKHLAQLTRKVREAIDLSPHKRVEMLVNYEFERGHQWAKALGFEVDAPRMVASGIYGNDETLYVRIKQ